MKRRINILAVLMLMLAMVAPFTAPLPAYAQDARTLTSMDFNIVGVTLSVGPSYQAVPQGIASEVTTGFVSNGSALPDSVLAMLPKDFQVVGDFSGPTYTTPITLTTTPGNPFALPSLPILGKYTLSNIRLVDSSGNALFAATPQVVTVESISDPLITSVTTKPLTLQDLNNLGVVYDSTNFTAYQFTAALGLQSSQVPVTFPVLIPNTTTATVEAPIPTSIGLSTTTYSNALPDNFSLTGFMLGNVEGGYIDDKGQPVALPPIPGIIIIPNNIGFLHQYFSALLLVSNGAPLASGLTVKNISATIKLPLGEDQVAGTDAAPGDDPLRMANGPNGYFPRIMSVMNAGPDGKYGTSDDVSPI